MKALMEHLENKEISLVVGPRQAGKTTLLRHLEAILQEKGEKTIFLNYDLDSDRSFFASQTELVAKIKLAFGENRGYVFLDEIQRKENAGLFLKGLYDMNLPYKFIVTGSGSLELKEKIHESLSGRKRMFILGPVSFGEFVNFRTDYRFEGKEREFFRVEKEQTRKLVDEYLRFGGYPKVVLATALEEKQAAITDIYQSYLEKDVAAFLRVEKGDSFSKLLRLLAYQQGQLVNYSELANSVGISQETIKRFIWYLEKTFIAERVYPFTRRRREIVKSPVVYFTDLGMVNLACGRFGQTMDGDVAGLEFQNLVMQTLKERTVADVGTVNYWRTKGGAEVDFVIDSGGDPIPIEVKYRDLKEANIPKGMTSFIKKYQPERAVVVNLSYDKEIVAGKTKVVFVSVGMLVTEG